MAEEFVGIRLIVGLGNPGGQYEGTRHNAGFWFADQVAERAGAAFRAEPKFQGEHCRARVANADVRLLKPATFMNHSGRAVAAIARYFDIDPAEVLIAYDELDLPVGTVRLKWSGGHGGHNGIRDSIAALGTRDFWRLRIGIGHPGEKAKVVGYVLSRPSRSDADAIFGAIEEAAASLPECVAGAFQRAMNVLHASNP